MKLLHLAAAASLVALAGCANLEAMLAGPPPAAESDSVAAAASLYTAAAKAADAVVKSNSCDKSCRDTIASMSHEARGDLDAALTAEETGDSAALTLALAAFDKAYPQFATYLATKGATP